MTNSFKEAAAIGNAMDNGIGYEKRKAVSESLCRLLADEHVLYIKTRNYHWNVTGMEFKALHELFEEQYTAIATFIDDIAERNRSLGFFSPGSMEAFRAAARLEESGHLDGNAKKMVQHLLLDHESIIQILRSDQEAAAGYKDQGTNDFLIGLMEEHEKMAWMLRAHLG